MIKTKGNPRVFVIDDDPVFNKLILQILRKYGVEAEAFQDPAALLRRVKERPPNLCIVDLNLGDKIKGHDLIQSLRESSHAEMPVVITSTTTDMAAITQAIEMGANDYLLKPLDREVLTAKLMDFFTTEELELSKPGLGGTQQQTEIDTTLNLDAKLSEVDEIGITLLSKHLIMKGSVLNLSGAIIKELTGKESPLLVTVVSVLLDPAQKAYVTYLEFEQGNAELSQNVRQWILAKG